MPTASRLTDRLLRLVFSRLHRLYRRGREPGDAGPGVHAAALTGAGNVILVKLRYAPGWRLPGGGRDAGEDRESGALRELREEIGMTAHGRVRTVDGLVIVEDVTYRPPRWSWEVEAIIEAPLDALPPDFSPRARRWLEAMRNKL